MIIPCSKNELFLLISQVLHRTEHQKNDLVEIFKSQASIAKDLPVLLKREQAHKEFLEDIVPFEEHLAKGVEHKEIVRCQYKGRKTTAWCIRAFEAIRRGNTSYSRERH